MVNDRVPSCTSGGHNRIVLTCGCANKYILIFVDNELWGSGRGYRPAGIIVLFKIEGWMDIFGCMITGTRFVNKPSLWHDYMLKYVQ